MISFNKKAQVGEQLMFFYFLFMLIVIGGGIAIGVLVFYGGGYDMRGAYSSALSYQIERCIMAKDIDWEISEDFYEKCNFDKEAIEKGQVIGILIDGNEKFKLGDYKPCGFADKKSEGFPVCTIKEFEYNENSYKVYAGSTQKVRSILG